MAIYDTKCIFKTKVTIGSILTHNATDGEKTIFYADCVGIQFKQSLFTIGYLQLETPSSQMNNKSDNFFSENTFTFESGKNNITNALMVEVYQFISDLIEAYKYNLTAPSLIEIPVQLKEYQPKIELEEDIKLPEASFDPLSTFDDSLSAFMEEISECHNATEIFELWKQLPSDNSETYRNITDTLSALVSFENNYGKSEQNAIDARKWLIDALR